MNFHQDYKKSFSTNNSINAIEISKNENIVTLEEENFDCK
jgi:hypothetical protein